MLWEKLHHSWTVGTCFRFRVTCLCHSSHGWMIVWHEAKACCTLGRETKWKWIMPTIQVICGVICFNCLHFEDRGGGFTWWLAECAQMWYTFFNSKILLLCVSLIICFPWYYVFFIAGRQTVLARLYFVLELSYAVQTDGLFKSCPIRLSFSQSIHHLWPLGACFWIVRVSDNRYVFEAPMTIVSTRFHCSWSFFA